MQYSSTSTATDKYDSIAGQTESIFTSSVKWEPGQTQSAYLAVKNNGNLALKYNLLLDITDKETNTDLTQAMAGAFDFVIINGIDGANPVTSWEAAKTAAGGSSTNLLDAIQAENPGKKSGRVTAAPQGQLATGASDKFAVVLHMNEEAGNAYQNGLIEVDVNLVATQLNAEVDGFNNPDYDKDATFPGIAPYVYITTTQAVATKGQAVTVKDSGNIATSTVKAASETGDIQIASSTQTGTKTEKNSYPMAAGSSLERTIETTAATDTSVTYDISYVYTEAGTSYDVHTFAGVVTNVIQLTAGLEDVKVTHRGTAMTKAESETSGTDGQYFYNSSTGVLTIWSKTYSEYTISYTYDYVASVGNNGYMSLQAAINDAASGDTVKLLKNTSEQISINKAGITLNGNGKKITVTSGVAVTLTDAADNVVLNNLNAESENDIALVVSDGAANVSVNKGSYKTATTSNVGKQGEGAIRFNGNNGTVSVTEASLLGGLHILNYASGTLTISGNTFAVDSSLAERTDIVCGILIYGSGASDQVASGDDYLAGNTFSTSKANYKVLIQDNTWKTLYSDKDVAKIEGKGRFATFEAALTAAASGDTIVLLAEINPTNNMTFNKTLTIDMNNFGFVRAKEASGGYKINLKPGCDLTLKNGTWGMAAAFGDITAEGSNGTCNVTYNNVKFVNMNNPTTAEIMTMPGNSTDLSMLAFKANMQGDFNVNASFTDCDFTNAKVEFSGNNSGNTFKGTFTRCTFNNITNSCAIKADNYGMTDKCSITVTGCVFNMTVTSNVKVFETRYNNDKVALNLSNNTVNGIAADPQKYKVYASTLKVVDSAQKFNVTGLDTTTLQGIATLN